MTLTPIETAVARQRAYALFSQLFLEGVTAVTQPIVQQIPELAATLPAQFDPDEALAEHQTLFGFNLFPYESFFLDNTGLLGGDVTDSVLADYHADGFVVTDDATSPDHIGHELAFLSRQLPVTSYRPFLSRHLLRWLPPFVLATRQQENAFYAALADLTLAFVADHATDLTGLQNLSGLDQLPIPPDLLGNEKTSVKDIAEFLTLPIYSGFYISRDDVARLGRRHKLPRGFGGRDQMLSNLFKTAVQYDALPLILADLLDLAEKWHADYEEMATTWPLLRPFVSVWQARVGETAVILQQVQQQAQQLAPHE